MSVLDGLTEPPYGDDLAGAVYEEDEKTFVVEAKIMGISLLLPFPLNVSVGTVAEKAYDEFKAMNPRAPPLKISCVRDKNNKILSRELKLKDHHLDRHFVVQVEEFNAGDLLDTPEGVDNEYRRWQLWTVDQIYDMIKQSLAKRADEDSSSVVARTQDIRKSKDYDERHHLDDGYGKEWAPVVLQVEQDVDQKWITLLDELSYTPHQGVKCACLEAFNLLRLKSSSMELVKAAALRICQMLVDEQLYLDVVVCAFNCFRVNAKGLLPLSSYHQKEIILLNKNVVGQYMHILARFPGSEDQRLIMSAYKGMYIHRYGMDTGVGRGHGVYDMHMHGAAGKKGAVKEGLGTEEKEDLSRSMDLAASMSFSPSDLHQAEETVIRLRTLLSSDETSVWKFAVTKLHTLLNELRNPLDHRSCFDDDVESSLQALFHSNQEVRYLTACLLTCLKASIDTKSAKFKQGRRTDGEDGVAKKASNRHKSKAKAVIDAALLSPETDIGMVKKVIDCLYLLALPFSFDTGVEDNMESAKLNALQVSISKACLEDDRWRLLLTLCYAQNLAIAGRCAFLFRLMVLVHGKENTEGNHWQQFQSSIDPGPFVRILHNDAANASDSKVVQYNEALNNTGFGSNKTNDIDSVEVLECHLNLLVLDYAAHLLNSKYGTANNGGSARTKEERRADMQPESARSEHSDRSGDMETARGEQGMVAFEKVLSKTSGSGEGTDDGGARPSGLATLRVGKGESGLEYVAKIANNNVSSSDKYLLEDVFQADNNALFLKIWRLANYTEIPTEERGAHDALRLACHYLQRKMALDILSQLVAMSSIFKDQIVRIAGIPKVIALVGDRSILRQKIDKYKLRRVEVSPRAEDTSERDDTGAGGLEADPELTNTASESDLGKMDDRDMVALAVDVEAVRYALKILVTLVVAQDSGRQKTIVRLIQGLSVGGEGSGITLQDVAQVDRQAAFFYATLVTLGNQYD